MRGSLPDRAGRWAVTVNKLVVDLRRTAQQHCAVTARAALLRGLKV
jgi:hypothetical protein